jgi:CheY-like chemotaxis protein
VNKNGSIIIIEDDKDDQLLLEVIYKKLSYKNELVFLENGEIAIEYLCTMKKVPFLIISDINMPKLNGIELRARVKQNEEVNIRCIPYVLLSTTTSKEYMDNAYLLGIQGYFKKPSNPEDFEQMLKCVIDYWKISYSPGMYI